MNRYMMAFVCCMGSICLPYEITAAANAGENFHEPSQEYEDRDVRGYIRMAREEAKIDEVLSTEEERLQNIQAAMDVLRAALSIYPGNLKLLLYTLQP